jgi:patatin-related protein
MADPSPQQVAYTREVRFAVVMYGGVSLAIYINGVAQELLRMVRATAPEVKDGRPLMLDELNGSERVYRKLSHLLADALDSEPTPNDNQPPTRFVIDTISGTSAGGINGVFLAKALANDQNIDELQQLWVREGAIEKLINDKWSKDPPLSVQDPPAALLNGQRMYFELLKAFDGMDSDGSTANGSNSGARSLVDELDLFVTATDLRGITLPIRLADEVVYERRHRNVFHFICSKDDGGRNDFTAKNNPFLAYAARCTSSFPFAFEPMSLRDTDAVLDVYGPYADDRKSRSNSDDWKPFFRSYADARGLKTVAFPRRAFADGGDLDNKPFTYVIETLARRHADVPVLRKLIYIEPSPEHPEDEIDIERKPNFIENVLDALSSLPRYETIREDLQRVVDRNRLIERLNRVINGVEEDEEKARMAGSNLGVLGCLREEDGQLWTKPELTDKEWAALDLTDMIRRKGRAYIAYHRMEIAALTDELAKLVTRVAGLDEESDYFLVIRSLVRAWRDKAYVEHRANDDRPTMNGFLHAFDLSYPLRRISFVQRKADQLDRLDEKAVALLRQRKQVFWGTRAEPSKELAKDFRDELRSVKRKLNPQYDSLRRLGRNLRSRYTPQQAAKSSNSSSPMPSSPVYQQIRELIDAIRQRIIEIQGEASSTTVDPVLQYFLGKNEPRNAGEGPATTATQDRSRASESVEDKAVRRAGYLLTEDQAIWSHFQAVAKELELQLKGMEAIDKDCLDMLQATVDPANQAKAAARECMCHYYRNYDDYDMITFPILYDTDVGEAAIVEVFRVSPEDAKDLINERSTKCRKLAGTALGHFGAFLERLWRENDILWGRLDGAERLITALLPPDHPERRALIGEAQAAIVYETMKDMGLKERQELLCESLMRTGSGDPEPDLLTDFISCLKSNASNDLKCKLNPLLEDELVRQYYLDSYDERSRLNPQSTLETVGRATTVVGKMFEDLAANYKVGGNFSSLIARCGQFFWSLVEVSVPRSIPNLLFHYWLKLLYLFEVLLIAGSTLLLNSTVQKYGLLLFGITIAIHFAVWVLGSVITARKGWLSLLRTLGVAVVAVFLIVGVLGVLGMLGFATPWKIMKTVHDWYDGMHAGKKLSARVAVAVAFVLFFLWAIRDDLRTLWRNKSASRNALKNVLSGSFEPIRIQPLTSESIKRIRRVKRFFFWRSKRCYVPFTLSAEPPQEWKDIFKAKWGENSHASNVGVKGAELRLACAPKDVQSSFQRLKEAVSVANAEYQVLVQKAKDEAKQRKVETGLAKELDCKEKIGPILNKLDYS